MSARIHGHVCLAPPVPWAAMAALAVLLGSGAAWAQERGGPSGQVKREGVLIGLDPGLAVRIDETGTPVYLRLDLRLAGALKPWLQLGADVRADMLATVEREAPPRRYEVGPVAAFFLARGLFTRVFVHLAAIDPVTFIGGGQLGYELSWDRFSALGFAIGADADIPVDGSPFAGYSVNASLYFTAYDIGTRAGRDPGGY